jgi:hypothetical protein
MAENGRRKPRPETFYGPQRSNEGKRLQFQVDCREELAWRREVRSPTGIADNQHGHEHSGTHQQQSGSSIRSQDALLAESSGIERTAALQAAQLDPGLVDRLTDDVIRRMEKRLRIERQRRGL